MNIRLELAYQPLFGGGIRGLGYFDVLDLPMTDVADILDWMAIRRKEEVKAAFKGS